MITIRRLKEKDMEEAIKLKILCWTEELSGKAENNLVLENELTFWVEWMKSADKYNDDRLLIGAYCDTELLGVAFGSYAEEFDIKEYGIELNGLWVYAKHRNKGVSLMLMDYLLSYYENKNMKQIVIYNPHYAPSNSYYIKLGAIVKRTEKQMGGKLPVDIFIANIRDMRSTINKLLKHH